MPKLKRGRGVPIIPPIPTTVSQKWEPLSTDWRLRAVVGSTPRLCKFKTCFCSLSPPGGAPQSPVPNQELTRYGYVLMWRCPPSPSLRGEGALEASPSEEAEGSGMVTQVPGVTLIILRTPSCKYEGLHVSSSPVGSPQQARRTSAKFPGNPCTGD